MYLSMKCSSAEASAVPVPSAESSDESVVRASSSRQLRSLSLIALERIASVSASQRISRAGGMVAEVMAVTVRCESMSKKTIRSISSSNSSIRKG